MGGFTFNCGKISTSLWDALNATFLYWLLSAYIAPAWPCRKIASYGQVKGWITSGNLKLQFWISYIAKVEYHQEQCRLSKWFFFFFTSTAIQTIALYGQRRMAIKGWITSSNFKWPLQSFQCRVNLRVTHQMHFMTNIHQPGKSLWTSHILWPSFSLLFSKKDFGWWGHLRASACTMKMYLGRDPIPQYYLRDLIYL